MPTKTDRQELLELRYHMPIRDVVLWALGLNQGRAVVSAAARQLEIADETLRMWCRELDIDIDDYRKVAAK